MSPGTTLRELWTLISSSAHEIITPRSMLTYLDHNDAHYGVEESYLVPNLLVLLLDIEGGLETLDQEEPANRVLNRVCDEAMECLGRVWSGL